MHIGFIGFGLIGGSIARAVRADRTRSSWTMGAWSPSGEGPAQAAADGIIDRAAGSAAEALRDADLVVLAAPPTACLVALDDLAGKWRTALSVTAVITDVASTKVALLAQADAVGLRYVGGHPMAGLELTGYPAGRADLFVDRPWVVIPGRVASPGDVERVSSLAEACRARVLPMDAVTHDRAVAGISHLPLILAAALVESVAGPGSGPPRADWPTVAQLAAGGWRDMTRLARGDATMGAGIAATNASALAERIREFQATLEAWRTELERPGGPDQSTIADRLRAAAERLGPSP